MRFNKQELCALASQTSQNFDREGILVMKERQDGFFRRSEGSVVRWCRLRGNLLFYLKGPEPWYEPIGVIVLGHHQVKVQSQDENGHWPFHIVWENGVCYRMATFHESERTLWLKAIQLAPYDRIHVQLAALREKLNRIRPVVDIATFRLQKGIVVDMNEIPFCELALSCDNLLCDAYGRPPSPMMVVYVQNPKGTCVKYGTTEIVQMCSNPCFSKTILFRVSDGLTGDAVVRLVVYDVREQVTETAVPMGYTSLKLSTIQEAQRLRVGLVSDQNRTVGFVTMNGWSLEPSYIGTSPHHSNERNCIDIPQKILCHRRSQSLPPRLGVKLKFPSYGSLIKQNLVNGYQATYRFHSGLGGDITVHEIMAEPKLCYMMPMQLLEIYIQREKELLEELLSVGDTGHWRSKQAELVNVHMSLLKHYSHCRRSAQSVTKLCFKSSAKKDDPSLEFVPVNLHVQRMWVHNDTLNKSGSHDIITVGAFTAHTHKAERTGGLIRLVQQVKDINSSKAELNSIINKIQAEYDNVVAVRRLKDELIQDLERSVMLMQAKQVKDVEVVVEGIRGKVKSILALWEPAIIEKSLSYIGWPKNSCRQTEGSEAMSAILRLTEQLSMFDTTNSDCDTFDASSSSSSKETSPTTDVPTLSSSVPNICANNCKESKYSFPNAAAKEELPDSVQSTESGLHFHVDYFKSEIDERSNLSHFRSFRSEKPRLEEKSQSFDSNKTRHGSLRYDFKNSASFEQVSYKCLIDSLGGNKKKPSESKLELASNSTELDFTVRGNNLTYLKGLAANLEGVMELYIMDLIDAVEDRDDLSPEDQLDRIKSRVDAVKSSADDIARWLRISHAALRLRCESPQWAREHASLMTRRDTCFSQALTTVTTGLLCWLCSVPEEIVVKLLSSGLGPLCGFEGLLSLYSTEKAMWGDMVVAIEDLQTVVFNLVKVAHSNTAIPQVSGTRGSITVQLPINDHLYARFTNKEHMSFTITAVFFNIGINEKATLAEALGETLPQYHSNSDNLDRIHKYYLKYSKIFPTDYMAASRASSRSKPLEEVMENLKIAVQKKIPKNIEVLHLASLATRHMNGVRFTSCKSAKDRTGMSVTLEQCTVLVSEYHLAEHEAKKALDIMRSEGCRRENTLKNIGIRKYAFTKKQVMSLPATYRPPAGTYGASQT